MDIEHIQQQIRTVPKLPDIVSSLFQRRPAHWLNWANHGYGLLVVLNHNFSTCPHSSQ